MSDVTIGNGNGTYNVSGGQGGSVTVGNGNDTVNVTGGANQAITIGNGNDTVTVTGATHDTITAGNGNDKLTVVGGANQTITIGNGNDTLTVTGATGDTITAGNGNDTVTVSGGSGNRITVGNGNITVVASGDHNDIITLGNGNDTAYLGANDTVTVGKGNDLLVLPSSTSTPTLAVPSSLMVLEDHTVAMNIGAALSAANFGTETIYGFGTNDQLQFSTSQVANFTALMADAQQVGQNTVITLDAADKVVLENVQLSSLKSKNFIFASGDGSSGGGTVSITITGVPADATLTSAANPSGVSFNASTNTWTVTAAALADLTLHAGEVTAANLTVTATNSTTGTSVSQTIALTINPVAPTLTAPASLTVNAGSSIALAIGETPFDARDTVSISISGVPLDATLSAGTSNGNGTWTLTPAQLAGLTLTTGQAAITTLTVTATNTQGQTASASSQVSLTVLPVLNVSLSVVGNAAVQEGQTLVASATIAGDNADAGVAISYQWQKSTDGGVTWTNVSATASGNFNGVVSSFYQMSEADEGAEFRVNASFTDHFGQVISSTTGATAQVADITPVITVPFSFAVDSLSIVKNGNQIYSDNFSQAPINSPTILTNGSPTPITFITQGSTWSEAGGKAIASSTGVAVNPNVPGGNAVFDIAVLNTNTNPQGTGAGQSDLGLKEDAAFTVTSSFDLVVPPTGSYGMELTDGTSNHGVDQLERLLVTKDSSGNTIVELVQGNLTTNPTTQTVLASQILTPAQLAANNEIELQFTHAANSTQVVGAFALGNNGTFGPLTTFGPTATAFTSSVTWTRADVGAFANTGVGLNVGNGQSVREGQTLTASATTNDADATLHYQWQSSSDGGQTWNDIAGASATSYVVQETDEGERIRVRAFTTDADNSLSASATSFSTGTVLDALPTVTTPVIAGTPQEGRTLTASASAGQSDNTLSYAWYSSADGYTNAIGFGPSYLVQEGDEGFDLEVKATATNDNGVSISAASAPTSPVLDALPTVTTPLITGTAQEGQTLTASASAGQGDNVVTYVWYSSADNYTNPIGTGATYVVQEGDENHTLEVIATATNENGVGISATSAATASVIDNASLSVTVGVVSNLAVQEGQTLVASATITGDADDVGATVMYQWQSSSDGGQTWTNVNAGAAGNFNGIASSFYQLTEADEGKVFRATASFTNDTGQTVAATSASTASVADVTPEITVPFSYAVDSLSIVKNGNAIYSDNFSTAPIASPDILSNGVPTPDNFFTQGSTWTESNGKAVASSTGVAVNPNIPGGNAVFDIAVLNTNTAPQGTGAGLSNLGLKQDAAFTVTSSFDLVTPSGGTSYGMELTDGTATHGVDQLERLLVTRDSSGNTIVELVQGNLTTNPTTQTVLASQVLSASDLASNNQIELQFTHAQNSSQVSGAFALGNSGSFAPLTTFSPTATAFTSSVTWTRADVGAFANTGVGLNVGNGQSVREGQTLTASATTNDADATLHYQWQSSSDGGQTWNDIAGANATSYVVQEADEGERIRVRAFTTDADNSLGASATSFSTGTVLDALPTVTTPVIAGTPQEGQTLTASASAGQSDNAVTYAWYSSADGYTNAIGFGPSYVVQEGDEGFQIEVKATATNGNGATISATSLATSSVLDAAPTVTTPLISGTAQEGQTLTASASAGQSDNTVTYQWFSSADNHTNPIGTGATYVVQEGDENHTLEVVATTTNDNGVMVSATSAATASVIDNASLSLTVSVAAGGSVQEGQTLVASATINGDADDAAATVTYQWQSSTDGGQTWTDVPATAAGGFGNPIPSSFYQLTEDDEGKIFRASASFVDDTGQTISQTSAPTTNVADITPVITVPFSYAVDSLSIVKNGTAIYSDNFSTAPIASPTILSNGVQTPIAFVSQGSTWTEAGGKAIASSTGVAVNPNVPGGNAVFDIAVLNTNTAPQGTGTGQSNLGLKENAAFTVTSSFDLTIPTTGSYGMELTDGTSNHGVDQLERLLVTKDSSGNTVVELVQGNLTTNPTTQTVLASQVLSASDLANNNQIELQFTHAQNSTQVTGAFALGNNGSFDPLTTFGPTATAFTSSVTWTRADVGAFANTGIGLNVGNGQSVREGQTLTASATTNDGDATLHFQWQSSSDGGTTWNDIAGANATSYVVQEADEGERIRVRAFTTDADNSLGASATSFSTGTVLDALPTVTTPVIAGTPQEGQTLTASASAGQSDSTLSYAWYSSADGYTNAIGFGPSYVVQEGDEGFQIEVKATAINDNGVNISATSLATSSVLDAAPTVTTPLISGTAQEGQTLTASASAGQSDNTVTYQWFSSADNYTNPIGTGSSYLVQETDEGFDLEVVATATNENGVSVAAASAPTSAVLDAPPTVTTPIITGTAQEGQTLTASASAGQNDNAVTYTWYSSADGYTNAIGTGATYVAQEGDENHRLEVIATATNDNGVSVSATSAATASVIDNASLSLSVGVVSNLPVQQGQMLVASATINGDADDAGATITYQWQSSSDGGQTWNNAGAGVAGNFSGVASSFYQLTEADEGNLFRATASFVDDTGQPVSSTSVTEGPVADITPEITVPFSYAVDNLSIVKNGTQIYTNNFSTAPINSPTILSNGVPTPITFITQGSTWSETGGKAIASSTGAAVNPSVSNGSSVFDIAILNTNTNPQGTGAGQSDLGLKQDATFTVTSIFDLTAPTGGTSYGMELTDGTSTHGVDQLERLLVTKSGSNTIVELVQQNLVTGTQTVVASQILLSSQLGGTNQIELQFTHGANTQVVTGGFSISSTGTFFAPTNLGTTSIFTNGVTWTRADVGAFTGPGVGLNIGAGQAPTPGQTLIASATTNDSDATLHYAWQSSIGGASWTAISGAADSASYVVQATDAGKEIRVLVTTSDSDIGLSASATSSATGAVSGPSLSIPSSFTVSAETPFKITGITATDGGDPIQISIVAGAQGSLALSSTSGLTVSADGSSGTLTFSGSQSAVAAALSSGIWFAPKASFSGTGTVAVSATDLTTGYFTTGSIADTVKSGAFTFSTLDAPGAAYTVLNGINNAGVIVGQEPGSGGNYTGFRITGGNLFTTIAYPGAGNTNADAINNNNTIAGYYEPPGASTPRQGFTMSSTGTFSSGINVPGGAGISTVANGINDAGVIVGATFQYSGTFYSGFIDSGNTFTILQAPGTSQPHGLTFADGINNLGQVVGYYDTNVNDSAQINHGFLYQNGTYTTLDDPNGAGGTWLNAINNAGQIVGWYADASGLNHGFLYSGGSFITLDDPNGARGTFATGINDNGKIVGYYTDASGVNHGFTAIDPPPASTVVDGATLEINAPSGDGVQFAGATGTLQLDQSGTFGGTISGFGGQNVIDLADVAFSDSTTLGYAAQDSGGTLSVTDGAHAANLALLGNYMASSFAMGSDGHGGTLISDAAAQSQPQLTQPHA